MSKKEICIYRVYILINVQMIYVQEDIRAVFYKNSNLRLMIKLMNANLNHQPIND